MSSRLAHLPAQPPIRLLFVCMGNICRSPAAEGIMRHLVRGENLEQFVRCESAGTIGFHQGHPPDARMTECALARGITLDSQARQFQPQDFDRHDLILTMDQENFRDIVALAPNPAARAKVVPMTEFCTLDPKPELVPDPYYGGPAGFSRVLDILENACSGLLAELRAKLPA